MAVPDEAAPNEAAPNDKPAGSGRPAAPRRLLLDTGPLVALANKRDQHPGWVRAELAALPDAEVQVVTCEAVLTEAHHLVRSRGGSSETFAALIERLAPVVLPAWRPHVLELLRKYPERMDLADACLLALVEEDAHAVVFTVDRVDFSVYRMRSGQVVPTIAPPN